MPTPLITLAWILFNSLSLLAFASENALQKELFLWAGATRSDGIYFSDAMIAQIAKKGLPPGSSRKTIFVVSGFHGQGGTQEAIDSNLMKLKTANPNLEIYAYQSMTMLHSTREVMYAAENFNRDAWLLRATRAPSLPEQPLFQLNDPLLYSSEKPFPYIDISKSGYQNWLMAKVGRLAAVRTPDGTPVYSGIYFDNTNAFGYKGYTGDLWRGYQHFSKYLSDAKIEALDAAITNILDGIQNNFPGFKVGFNGFAATPWREDRSSAYYSHANAMLNEEFCAYLSQSSPDPIYANFNDIIDDIRVSDNFPGTLQMYQMNYIHPTTVATTKRVQNYCFGLYLATVHTAKTRYGAGRYGVVETLAHNPRITDFGTAVGASVPFGTSGFTREFSKGYVLVNASNATVKFPAPINGIKVRAFNYNGNPIQYSIGQLISVPARQAVFLAKFQTARFELKEKVGFGCGDVLNFSAAIVPQKGPKGEFVMMGMPAFSSIENHWNDEVDRGITNAYRFDIFSGADRMGYALGTTEAGSAVYPFRATKVIWRQHFFSDGTLQGDCRYELQ